MGSSLPLGSNSSQPDLDWSQLKETMLMLNLAVSQIDHSMHDGNKSVNTLASSFTMLANIMKDMEKSLHQLPEGDIRDNLTNSTECASANISSAIINFQFYDKLSQRLSHVSKDLAALNTLISDPSTLYSPYMWKQLQEQIRDDYTMEEERKMFDKVLAGVSIEQAIQELNEDLQNKGEDDIELF